MKKDNDGSELRKRAEERLKKSGVTPDILRSKEELLRIVQELSIHQIELEMQNETLQDSRDEIEREHNRYINLYDFSPVGYLTLARDGTILEANLTIARMLSIERSKLKGRMGGFGRFIAHQDLPVFNSMVDRVFQSRTLEHCEIMIGGISFRLDAIISDNSQEYRVSLTDIHDTRQALELVLANKELVFQNEEKEKRAAELVLANKELLFQNEEKEKRAAELVLANKELIFQNEEKEKRAAELVVANKELAFQNEEKEKRAVELVLAITAQKDAEQKILNHVKQLENAMQTTLQAVAKVVEAHDPYTAGHELRVGQIAADIAREMGWSEETCQTMQLVGLVHDIGKMSIPGELLTKPGKLSAIEFELIKTHAENGYEILKDVEFPLPIARIIREHHERMDGSGYPQGLKGEEILIESRILAVADILEAMASHRPYRASFGIDAAISEIETNRGSLFDPEVVDAMLRLFREKDYHLPD
ncbi:MAG: HD domain-containing phosphohydrolase [Chlorobiaceae bacterium]